MVPAIISDRDDFFKIKDFYKMQGIY